MARLKMLTNEDNEYGKALDTGNRAIFIHDANVYSVAKMALDEFTEMLSEMNRVYDSVQVIDPVNGVVFTVDSDDLINGCWAFVGQKAPVGIFAYYMIKLAEELND